MQTKFKSVIPRALDLFLACLLIVGGLVATMPTLASGLEVQKCTARSNADNNSSDILGGTETRVTLEVQATSAEQVKGMSLTFPDGTTFSTDETRVTALTGADRMTRNTVNATATANGQTLNLDFATAAPKNSYIRVEIYGVFFPSSGGDMNITGTYTLANGQTSNIDGIPAIKVTAIDPAQQLSDNLAQQDWVQAWNSNRFLHLFFDPTILVSSFPVVLNGFFMALAIVAVSFPLAIPLGLLLALMRMSKIAVLRGIASVYVNVVRGTPLFLQIYIAFFGLPLAGIDIASFPLGVIVLSMNSCAYQCEIIRAGIQSIPKGQFEASRSLGMNAAQTMMYVIIPQTVRRIIPTMTNEFILLYKDTSMLAAVGVMEVVMYAKTIVANTGSITPYIVAACFYLVITLPLAKVVGNLERKLAGNDSGTSTPRKKRKDKAFVPPAEASAE